MIIQDELSEESFDIETEGSRDVYTLEDVVLDLGEMIAKRRERRSLLPVKVIVTALGSIYPA